MFRLTQSILRQNSNFVVALCFGIALSIFLSPVSKDCINVQWKPETAKAGPMEKQIDVYEPKINLAAKPKNAVKSGHNMIRPRFHKAELGIKNKLFLAVLTSPNSIASLAIALNKTASKSVNKLMFFIDAPSAQRLNVSMLKLPGIVGFTDTNKVLKPFHLIKYVSDNFLEDFDFFFIIKDSSYIHAEKLNEFVRKISINHDIHVGQTMQSTAKKFCSLDFGILLSNSVMKKVHKSLDWCVKNYNSNDDSINVGKCVFHASQVPCSEFAQNAQFNTYNMKHRHRSRDTIPTDENDLQIFQASQVIGPLTDAKKYFSIHFHQCLATTVRLKHAIEDLRKSIYKISSVRGIKTTRWPTASQPAAVPLTHFDILRWDHFTLTHKYLHNDFSNLVPLSGSEKEDIQKIISKSISHIEDKYNRALKFHKFINGYKKFDASRGMDYIIDLAFRETTNGNTIHKRLEAYKAIGKVELVPVPYVTENVRVHVIIPVTSSDTERILVFLKQYSINAMEKKDLQFLMLVFIYDAHELSKGDEDIFKEVKNKAVSLSSKFEKVGNVIKWHSIRLPADRSELKSLTGSILDFAVLDSVLRKLSSESLILLGRPNMEIRLDYFNRVRMNTVSNFQIFSPIPFSEYLPDIVYNQNHPQPPELDINKSYGHYDSTNYRHISFYTVDYFKARKKIENILPIVRNDKDIVKVLSTNMAGNSSYETYTVNGLYNMFLRVGSCHVLRAVEPSLRLRHTAGICNPCRGSDPVETCHDTQSLNLATRSHLGRLILDYKSEVKHLSFK